MTEQQVFDAVVFMAHTHPEWIGTMMRAMTAGIQSRLAEEQTLRASQEAALCIAFEAGKAYIPEQQKAIVVKALTHTAMFAGTPYEARLREEYKDMLK